MLHVTHVANCHNLHAVSLLHRGINDSIGKYHVTVLFTEVDITMMEHTEEQRRNAIAHLQAGAKLGDVVRHVEVCRATTKIL